MAIIPIDRVEDARFHPRSSWARTVIFLLILIHLNRIPLPLSITLKLLSITSRILIISLKRLNGLLVIDQSGRPTSSQGFFFFYKFDRETVLLPHPVVFFLFCLWFLSRWVAGLSGLSVEGFIYLFIIYDFPIGHPLLPFTLAFFGRGALLIEFCCCFFDTSC